MYRPPPDPEVEVFKLKVHLDTNGEDVSLYIPAPELAVFEIKAQLITFGEGLVV